MAITEEQLNNLESWEKEWVNHWKYKFEITLEDFDLSDSALSIKLKENIQKELDTDEFVIDREAYKILVDCSQSQDSSIWDRHREWNNSKIYLDGAFLENLIFPVELGLDGVSLKNARMFGVHLKKVHLKNSFLKGTDLRGVHFEEGTLDYSHLQGAKLWDAHLEDSYLINAHLENADLSGVYLERACLWGTHLTEAKLEEAHLDGTKFIYADISKIEIREIQIDSATDFTGSNLADALIDPGIRGALEYNIRRSRWHEWYKVDKKAGWSTRIGRYLTRWFWSVSDYGISSTQILKWFNFLAWGFAVLYYVNPKWLEWNTENIYWPFQKFIYSLYFSVVTMTTLGFGDIHANPESTLGQIFLMMQVILGYVLLGALVTRLGVVFTGLGPVKKPEYTKEHLKERKREKGKGERIIATIMLIILIMLICKWPCWEPGDCFYRLRILFSGCQ